MNPKQLDKVLKIAQVMAYGIARERGADHLEAIGEAIQRRKHYIDAAYEFLGYETKRRDVRAEL